MSVEPKYEQRVWALIDKVKHEDKSTIDYLFDLIVWGHYSQDVFSQFSLGLQGFVFRQQLGSVRATVKAVDSGTPLVAFVTSANTTGCIEQMFSLLWADRLKWQKDKYPWI